jgi:hypothetical protein
MLRTFAGQRAEVKEELFHAPGRPPANGSVKFVAKFRA